MIKTEEERERCESR